MRQVDICVFGLRRAALVCVEVLEYFVTNEEAAERLAALLHGDAYVSDGNKLSPGLSPQRKLAAIS